MGYNKEKSEFLKKMRFFLNVMLGSVYYVCPDSQRKRGGDQLEKTERGFASVFRYSNTTTREN
jgi:hypothetical protein